MIMSNEKKITGLNNPQDKVFRETYSDFDNACSLISNAMPDRVLKLMDLSTLEICK